MPKQACCCNPVGRHIAVACRYYGRSGIYSLNGDVGAAYGASGSSGSSGGSTTNIITGIEYGYGGDDGFLGITSGIQKFFGWTAQEPAFGNDQSGYMHRGPVKWVAEIKQFDTTRDIILLSRSGGGSSQYEWDESEPKGGHSALLQSRVKASLALEGFAGIGGKNYNGGFPSLMSEQLEDNSDPTIVGGGAGGGGGRDARGGYGGITYGYRGDGSFGGYGGGKNSAGLAGGPSAFNGGTLYGGSGANNGGGGGGGRYAGGGGDQGSGGGGGASKWPSNQGGSSFDDVNYSENASDLGPGGVCDPFIYYYPLDTVVYGWHAGMGGGANIVFDLEADQNLNSSTRFLGFGYDYNPFKQGIPGVITAVWVDKYCPCSEIAEGSTGATGGQVVPFGEQEEQSTETSNSSTELPAKMYICLTDEQYQVLENFKDPENEELNVPHPRFTLNGETYIYVGVCVNSYCPSIRLVEGTPTNLAKTDLGGNGAASFTGTYNDCCDVMICSRYCKIPEADCYSCRWCGTQCATDLTKPKYCCENLDEKPDQYWSKHEGWLWWCRKVKKFWYPFGVTPEDTLPPTNELSIDGMAVDGPFEKGCLPITSSGLTGITLQNFINSTCFPINPQIDCTDYSGASYYAACTIQLDKKYWGGKISWPVKIKGDLCVDLQDYSFYAWDTDTPDNCDCIVTETTQCKQVGCPTQSQTYEFTYNNSELIPILGGWFARKYTGCIPSWSPNAGLIKGEVYVNATYLNRNLYTGQRPCKQVLGLTVKIPRCHPDPTNPQITDLLKNNGITVFNNTGTVEGDQGAVVACDKTVFGWGTLQDFISVLQNNSQMDFEITVNEPKLWLSRRPYIDPYSGNEVLLPPDSVYRIKVTETIDYRLMEYYFIPFGLFYTINGSVSCLESFGSFRKYRSNNPVCNYGCECESGLIYDVAYNNPRYTEYAYYAADPYYLYKNENGNPPTLVPGTFVPNLDIDAGGNIGLVNPPKGLLDYICEGNTYDYLSTYIYNAAKSHSDCQSWTWGIYPDCTLTSSIEKNVCEADFLTIAYT